MTQLTLSSVEQEMPAILRIASRIRRPLRFWMVLLVGLVGALVYVNSIPNQFAYDDAAIVQYNRTVIDHQWLELWSGNYWPTDKGPTDVLYRPLTIWSYAANNALGPTSVWHYHAVNVLLHALISMMVAGLAWRIMERRGIAIIAGLLFAVHPLHGEVIANVVGRAELLAAFWSLVALLLFLPAKQVLDGPPAQRNWTHGWLIALCFLLAMLSKETPAPLPAMLVVIDLWRWSNWSGARPTLRRWLSGQTLRFYLPMAVAFGVYMAMRIHATGLMTNSGNVHPVVNLLTKATIPQRIVTPFLLLAKYFMLMIWPQTLSADWSAPSIMPTANPFDPMAALGILLVAGAVAVVVCNWRKNPRVVLTILLFALSYSLVANVLRIGTIFGERLFYWPSVFVSILFGYAAMSAWEWLAATTEKRNVADGLRWGALVCLAFVLTVLGTRTWDRNPIWHDNVSLALATAEANPNSCKACDWAGAVLFKETKTPWMIKFGEQLVKRSIELYPDNGLAYWDLATYYGRVDQPDQALWYMAYAARYFGGTPDVRGAFVSFNEYLKKTKSERYLPFVEQKLKENPENAEAQVAYALAMIAQNKLAAADEHLMKAMSLDSAFIEATAELGMVRGMRGNFGDAVKLLKYYVILIPYNGIARCDLAGALMEVDPKQYPGALPEAEMNLRKAATLLPNDPNVRKMELRWLTKSGQKTHNFAPLAIDQAK
jgi:tetratricopeptide (TPR) repeat protein